MQSFTGRLLFLTPTGNNNTGLHDQFIKSHYITLIKSHDKRTCLQLGLHEDKHDTNMIQCIRMKSKKYINQNQTVNEQ